MEISPKLLFDLLLLSLVSGAAMGLLYDVLRIQRVLFGMSRYTAAADAPAFCPKFCTPKTKKESGRFVRALKQIFLAIQDFFFCLAVGGVIAALLFYKNNGEFRGFVFAGVVLGFAAYYFTVGKLVVFVSEYVVFALKTAFLYAIYYLTLPFIALGRFLLTHIKKSVRQRREKRDEKRIRRYHVAESQSLFHLAEQGFLVADNQPKKAKK